jgi:predicted transcriptional regulator
MSETTETPIKTPRPIEVFKERVGGLSARTKQYVQEQNNAKRLIRSALRAGPKTVPQIATESGLDSGVVLWHVMAMKRYGRIIEMGVEGAYPSYSLKET